MLLFRDMINVKNLDLYETKIDEKSYKNIVYYRWIITTVKNVNFNTLALICFKR